MTCRECMDLMVAFLEGTRSAPSAPGFQAHLGTCGRCSEVWNALNGKGDLEGTPDLAPRVLERTTGPACESASLALAQAERPLDPLVAEHLRHCPRCQALRAVLDWLVPTLRRMGDLPPPRPLASVLPVPEKARARRASGGWVPRPLVGLQVAYLGGVLLVGIGQVDAPARLLRGASRTVAQAVEWQGTEKPMALSVVRGCEPLSLAAWRMGGSRTPVWRVSSRMIPRAGGPVAVFRSGIRRMAAALAGCVRSGMRLWLKAWSLPSAFLTGNGSQAVRDSTRVP